MAEQLKREFRYVVTFWGGVWEGHGRMWISREVGWPVDSEEEGHSQASKVVASMAKEHGSDLRWVDLETKAGAGEWELIHRFPAHRPSG